MKATLIIFTLIILLASVSCNEAKRGNDSDMAYDADNSQAQAKEANKEKFNDNDMRNDADFVAEAVADTYEEIKLAQIADQRSSQPEIKEISKMLATHHAELLNELKRLAQAKAFTVPVEEGAGTDKKIEKLVARAGADFDKQWVQEMIDRHEETIDKFEKRLGKTEDTELQAALGKMLPEIKDRLQQLTALNEKMKSK